MQPRWTSNNPSMATWVTCELQEEAYRQGQQSLHIPTWPKWPVVAYTLPSFTLFVKSSSCHQGISSNPKLWGWFATSKESLPHKLSSGPWDSPSCDLKKKQRKLSKNGTKFLKQHPWPRTIIHFNATWDARQGTPWIQHRPSCADVPTSTALLLDPQTCGDESTASFKIPRQLCNDALDRFR